MAALREVLAVFGVKFDSKELDKGNKSIEEGIAKLKRFGAALGASALVGGVIALTRGVADQVDQLAKQSIRLGISTQALQEYRHAANLSGIAAGTMDDALTKLSRNIDEAANGNKTLTESFKRIGVPIKVASGAARSLDDVLGDVANAINGIQDPSQRTAIAMDLFGRSGAQLITMLETGSEGIAAMRAEVSEFGAVVGDDFATAAQEMNDNLARMQLATFGLKTRLANLLIPVISRVAIFAARATAAFGRWTDSVKQVIGQGNALKAAVAWLGVAGLTHVLKLVGGFRGLWGMFRRGIAILARFALRIALPILLVDELITTFQGGDTLIRRALDNMFGEGSTDQVIGFCKTLKKNFTDLFTDFEGVVNDFETFFKFIWEDLLMWTEAIMLELVAPFEMAAADITDAFGAAWNDIIDGATRAIATIAGLIDKLPAVRAVARLLGSEGGLRGVAESVGAGITRAEGGNAARTAERLDVQRLDLARRMDATRAVPGPVVNGSTVVNVTVPPGTPANMARSVGNAAAQGANRGNRATLAAVRQAAPG